MKVVKSSHVNPFGGINFVLEALVNKEIDILLESFLPSLAPQSKYSWKDILFAYWSIPFCGGDCAEDIAVNLRDSLGANPYMNVPSPDRVLGRLKELSEPSEWFKKKESRVPNQFSINKKLNELNLKLLKKLSPFEDQQIVLDYDNTFIFSEKSDAKRTYKKEFGYCPAVGIIGSNVVYVENRNGNCGPQTLQEETLERMFTLLSDQGIKVNVFRADSASYQFLVVSMLNKFVDKFFIKAKVNPGVSQAIGAIDNWTKVEVDGKSIYRGSTTYVPFEQRARKAKKSELVKPYRLVVTKEERADGQVNMFTGEACNYSPILTNDLEMTDNEVALFYNARGKKEREFDILKNDFLWNKMPYSKLGQNTVFLIMMAICRNIYNYIITSFSKVYKGLSAEFRIKKFIFRFISIPAKWVRSSRTWKLRLYGDLAFKT
ncbi:IS1380 family transposase [Roseivirga echinicomitans]